MSEPKVLPRVGIQSEPKKAPTPAPSSPARSKGDIALLELQAMRKRMENLPESRYDQLDRQFIYSCLDSVRRGIPLSSVEVERSGKLAQKYLK